MLRNGLGAPFFSLLAAITGVDLQFALKNTPLFKGLVDTITLSTCPILVAFRLAVLDSSFGVVINF